MLLSRSGRFPLLCALLVSAGAAQSQEYFREFGTSRTSGGIGRLSPGGEVFTGNDPQGLSPIVPFEDVRAEEETYNFRLGNVDFIVAAGLGIEFNDNINLSESDRRADIIFRPTLDLEGVWRFSESNRMRFGLGIGYAKYLSHDEYDSESLLISPTSAIAWTFVSGAFTITLRDRFTYQEDPFDLPVLSGVANYRRWENQAGVQVEWALNEPTKLTFGYDRYDLWATDEVFRSQDRGIDTVYLRPSYQVAPSLTLGLNTSVSWVNFRENLQSDSLVWLVGPYVMWRADDYTDVYLEIGYQRSSFEVNPDAGFIDPVTGVITSSPVEETGDSSSVYAKMEIRRRPTEYFRHKLVASKTTETGYGSNYYDLLHVEWTADWRMGERTSLAPTLFYEFYETSGQPSEEAHRFGAAVGLHHILSDHLTVGFDYRFLWKDSNAQGADYYQNLAMLSFYYKF